MGDGRDGGAPIGGQTSGLSMSTGESGSDSDCTGVEHRVEAGDPTCEAAVDEGGDGRGDAGGDVQGGAGVGLGAGVGVSSRAHNIDTA